MDPVDGQNMEVTDLNFSVTTAMGTLSDGHGSRATQREHVQTPCRFFEAPRTMAIRDIAKMFQVPVEQYQDLCKYVAPGGPEGAWMRKLNRNTFVLKGSHMPIYPFPGYDIDEPSAPADAPVIPSTSSQAPLALTPIQEPSAVVLLHMLGFCRLCAAREEERVRV